MKQLFFSITVILICFQLTAQYDITSNKNTYSNKTNFEFAVNSGFFIGGHINNYDINNAIDYSVALSFSLPSGTDIELSYTGANPKSVLENNDLLVGSVELQTHIHYLQLGGIRYLTRNQSLRPYGMLSIGAVNIKTKAIYNTAPDDFDTDNWLFAATAGVGLKYDINRHIGLRLQGRALLPMTFTGSGLGINIGSGGIYPSLSLNSYTTFIQGDISLGIYFKF